MTGVLQSLDDLKTVVTTDRRVWMAAGFVACCAFIFMVTGSWREPIVEEEPEEWRRVRIPHHEFNDLVNELNAKVEQSKEDRRELRARLNRAANEIQTQQKEIDWQVDRLVDSLDSMSSKVDSMVNRVGAQLIQEKQLEREVGARKKKSR